MATGSPQNGQNSSWGEDIEKTRERRNGQNSIWGKTRHLQIARNTNKTENLCAMKSSFFMACSCGTFEFSIGPHRPNWVTTPQNANETWVLGLAGDVQRKTWIGKNLQFRVRLPRSSSAPLWKGYNSHINQIDCGGAGFKRKRRTCLWPFFDLKSPFKNGSPFS